MGRSSCALLAFTDVGLASAAAEKLAWEDAERYGPAAETLKNSPAGLWSGRRSSGPRRKKRQAARRKPWAAPAAERQAAGKKRAKKSHGPRGPKRPPWIRAEEEQINQLRTSNQKA